MSYTQTDNAQTHLNHFGNTTRIEEGMLYRNLQEELEVLDNLISVMGHNKNKIDYTNQKLQKKDLMQWLYTTRKKAQHQQIINYMVRERLVERWNRQLTKMKL